MDNNIIKTTKERSDKQKLSDIKTSERMKLFHQQKLLNAVSNDNDLKDLIITNVLVDAEHVDVNTAIKKRMGRPRRSLLCIEPIVEHTKIVDGIKVEFN